MDYNLNTMNLSSTKDGVLPKWISNDYKYFYKAGMLNYGEYNNIYPVYECICSDIAEFMSVDSLKYNLEVVNDILTCKSKNFTLELDEGVELLSAYDFCNLYGIDYNSVDFFNQLCNLGEGITKDISKMIIFDFIINNEDRHLNNFMFKVSTKGVELFTLFDNERSLLHGFTDSFCNKFLSDGFHNKQIDSCKPFRGHHFKQISLVSNLYDINLEVDIDLILSYYKEYLSELQLKVISKLVKGRLEYVKQFYFNA